MVLAKGYKYIVSKDKFINSRASIKIGYIQDAPVAESHSVKVIVFVALFTFTIKLIILYITRFLTRLIL
jgi:hypothetical protein